MTHVICGNIICFAVIFCCEFMSGSGDLSATEKKLQNRVTLTLFPVCQYNNHIMAYNNHIMAYNNHIIA